MVPRTILCHQEVWTSKPIRCAVLCEQTSLHIRWFNNRSNKCLINLQKCTFFHIQCVYSESIRVKSAVWSWTTLKTEETEMTLSNVMEPEKALLDRRNPGSDPATHGLSWRSYCQISLWRFIKWILNRFEERAWVKHLWCACTGSSLGQRTMLPPARRSSKSSGAQ